jgi:uncharacterized protein with PIN domain
MTEPLSLVDDKKPGRVVCMCPVCKKKVRDSDRKPLKQSLLASQSSEEVLVDFVTTTCLGCGVDYLMPNELKALKKLMKEKAKEQQKKVGESQ